MCVVQISLISSNVLQTLIQWFVTVFCKVECEMDFGCIPFGCLIALDQIAGQNNRIVLDDWIRTALNLQSLYLCSIYCNVNPDSKQIRLAMDHPVVTGLLYLLPGLRVPELHPTGPPGLESTWTKDHTTDWKCPYYEQQVWWADKTLLFFN